MLVTPHRRLRTTRGQWNASRASRHVRRSKLKPNGFTLAELMIVVAILALLAVIATPSFTAVIAMTRLKAAATDIHLSLMRARSEAVKRNVNATVLATSGWAAGWAVTAGADTIEMHDAIVGGGITVSGQTTVTYLPNGRVLEGQINISLKSSETSLARCVSVTLAGQPTIKPEACS